MVELKERAADGLRLGALIDHEEFNLKLVVGGDDCRSRSIVGVHGTEVDQPARWLEAGWVMLTTGTRLPGCDDAQRELIAELDTGGMTALGFGLGETFAEIPDGIFCEARERKFPLFEIPPTTPLTAVVSFATNSILSQDFYVLRRIVSMQNHLVSSVCAKSPEEELTRKLSKLLDSSVALFRLDGTVDLLARRGVSLSTTDPAWAAELWEAIDRKAPSVQQLELGDLKVVVAPVEVDGLPRSWLAVVTRLDYTFANLARPLAESAARLLAAVATAHTITATEERVHQSQLIEQILSNDVSRPDGFEYSLAEYGLDFSAPARVVEIAGGEDVDLELEQVAARLVGADGMPLLWSEREGRVIAVVQMGLDEFETAIGADRGLMVGMGRPASSVFELCCSARDARLAVEQLAGERADGILRFEDFDLSNWLLMLPDRAVVQAKVEGILDALKSKPEQYETTRCYLSHDLNVIATATALDLHPNTLRYRLSRIEDALGMSLRKPATIASVYLALTFDSIAGAPERSTRSEPSIGR